MEWKLALEEVVSMMTGAFNEKQYLYLAQTANM
jgi:hypothetical protein